MADQPKDSDELRKACDREIARLATSSEKAERQEAVRRLWTASHQRWIEGLIELRLLDAGLFDPDHLDDFDRRVENTDFSNLWMHVVESIYSVKRITGALTDFDADKGTLTSWLRRRVHMVIHGWLRDRQLTAGIARTISGDAEQPEENHVDEECSSFDEALVKLTDTQRACQTLQVVPFRNLVNADWDAIRREGAQNGVHRSEVDLRVDKLVARNRWDAKATQRYVELLTKLNRTFTGVEKAKAECQYWRGILVRHGLSEEAINDLHAAAEKQTLEQIEETYAEGDIYVFRSGVRRVQNRKLYSQKKFQLWSRRLVRRLQTLENAREKLEKFGGDKAVPVTGTSGRGSSEASELVLRPVPNLEISQCLNKTVQSVHSALHAAKKKLKEAGFHPPSDGDDESGSD
jgi:hypothetical protein